jgi:hypothetical protein
VGYVLTEGVLFDMRGVLNWAERQLVGATEPSSFGLTLKRIRGALEHVDGLDPERLHELATWAREQARAKDKVLASAPPGETERVDAAFGSDFTGNLRRKQAETARVIEISTDVLTALALDKLPPGAVLNIGRDEEQANAKPTRFYWPSKAERAASIGPVGMSLRIDTSPGGDECHLCQAAIADEDAATCTSAGCPRRAALEVEPAANGKMSREQFEALPSHDRVVLSRIFGELIGEPGSGLGDKSAELVWDEVDAARAALADSLGAPLLSTWPDIIRIAAVGRDAADEQTAFEQMIEQRDAWEAECTAILRLLDWQGEWTSGTSKPRRIAAELLAVLATPAPRYSLPESHPLRQYQWAEWLGMLLEREERPAGSGLWSPDIKRVEVLRLAKAKVAAHDADGLAGLAIRLGSASARPMTTDELALLGFASGHAPHTFGQDERGGIKVGCHRIPRVRGETVEVGT